MLSLAQRRAALGGWKSLGSLTSVVFHDLLEFLLVGEKGGDLFTFAFFFGVFGGFLLFFCYFLSGFSRS